MAKLLPVEKRVYELIKERRGIDVNYISSVTGIPPAAVEKIIFSLVKKGVLVELSFCTGEKCDMCPLRSVCFAKPWGGARIYLVRGEKK